MLVSCIGLMPSVIPSRFACLNTPERKALMCLRELRPSPVLAAICASSCSPWTVRNDRNVRLARRYLR